MFKVAPTKYRGSLGTVSQIGTCLGIIVSLFLDIPAENDPHWWAVYPFSFPCQLLQTCWRRGICLIFYFWMHGDGAFGYSRTTWASKNIAAWKKKNSCFCLNLNLTCLPVTLWYIFKSMLWYLSSILQHDCSSFVSLARTKLHALVWNSAMIKLHALVWNRQWCICIRRAACVLNVNVSWCVKFFCICWLCII